MKNLVREPQQERSIEKKNKIIQSGYELFSEVGYYGTNTVEIAKRAGVSTGIVYGYFQDKRDILICVLKIYIEKVSAPILDIIKPNANTLSLYEIAQGVIDRTLDLHKENAKLHNTLHSLATTDELVNAEFMKLENNITKRISEQLAEIGVSSVDILEKTHLAMNIVQSFAHEYVFDKHNYLDYPKMKEIVCKTLVTLFE
ncbi:MAG: TetR/AcrR family transcriptional regulator [Corallococcus sp.]|nr:TetR/AcrR family transcriptional regulator [Bacillota bacterium]MCM1533919.1 TetR/AcrR family transcriptional regulator [Corallococcus sp.]